MNSLPFVLHLEKDAVPVAFHKASPIPLNWQEEVKRDFERDVALGVIEKVPPNTPVEWCSRMSVVAKKDRSAWSAIDLRPVNQVTLKQTHLTESPFTLASMVPPNTWKSTSDA